MNKKIRRILCIVLLFAILVSVAPPQKAAAASTDAKVQEVVQTVQDVYRGSQQGAGRYSFFGYCGTMIAWHLYLLGITDRVRLGDGKDFFNYFYGHEYSSGGFPVKAYPSWEYSLYSALNAITANGSQDAYNILVGFERTPSQAGSLYGHALVIFAIIDGIVYFNQSYGSYLYGVYYPEGGTIALSIVDFCNLFSGDVLDGVVYFGRKSYSESCTYYPANLDAQITESTHMYTEPCLDTTDERSKILRPLQPGEPVRVTGLYLNPLGEYWYQVEEENKIGYVPAQLTRVLTMRYDDVSLRDASVAQELRQGQNANIGGSIYAAHNRICTVRAQIFAMDGKELTHVMSGTHSLDARRYQLYRSELDYQLDFRGLQPGTYRLELAVVVGNYYFADGELQTQWKTIKLWRSDFKVVHQLGSTYHVKFDAAGGTAALNQANVSIGDRLKELPQATRPGYVFEGWYNAEGIRFTSRTVIAESTTLYARWKVDETATGWYLIDGNWAYLEEGVAKTGFIRSEGSTCYIQEDGTLATGWLELEGKLYYFYPSGVMHMGWMDREEGRSYFTANGAATGWMVIGDNQYYFDQAGIMLTGRQTIDEEEYIFGSDGVLKK